MHCTRPQSKEDIYKKRTISVPIQRFISNALQTLYLHCSRREKSMRLASLDGGSGVLAVVGGALGDGLGLVSGGGALELLADGLDGRSARVGDGGAVTEVGVDASEDLSVVGLDVLDDEGAGNAVLAVTAGTVELAEVDDG